MGVNGQDVGHGLQCLTLSHLPGQGVGRLPRSGGPTVPLGSLRLSFKDLSGSQERFSGALLGPWRSGQPSPQGFLPNHTQPPLLSREVPPELSSCFKETAIRKSRCASNIWAAGVVTHYPCQAYLQGCPPHFQGTHPESQRPQKEDGTVIPKHRGWQYK